tara:strand:- start:1388 stop:2377 length:990 start_codon:yes stop_codon:yes gene_type:complete
MQLNKKKILITGSSGYIGSCLKKFLENKFKVYGIDKNELVFKEKNFFKTNILSINKLEKIIENIKPDIIIHLAAQSTIDNIKKKNSYIKNNIKATNILLRIVKKKKIKYFLFASTAAVYKSSKKKLSEKSQTKPNNIYGKTKHKCEINIRKKLNNNLHKFLIFRFFNVCSALKQFKIGEMHEPETHLIPIIVNKFLNKKKIILYSNNKSETNIRDYVHIYDLCNAIYKGIIYLLNKKKSYVFNIGSINNYHSTWKIINYFNKYFAKNKLKYTFSKKRLGDEEKLICSIKKIKKILKWKPINSKLSIIFRDELVWQKYLRGRKIINRTIY